MGFITELTLRNEYKSNQFEKYFCERGTRFTPAALQFLSERKIEIVYGASKEQACQASVPAVSAASVTSEPATAKYVDFNTGAVYNEKPEHMTHIIGNKLVVKSHPRIAFRGKIDSFMANLISLQVTIAKEGYPELLSNLDEVLEEIRTILRSEVIEQPIPVINLMGMDEALLREYSHYPQKYFGIGHLVMSYKYGEIAMGLNKLRTEVREVELAAINAFVKEDAVERKDILQALNRISSCFYVMQLKFVSNKYKK